MTVDELKNLKKGDLVRVLDNGVRSISKGSLCAVYDLHVGTSKTVIEIVHKVPGKNSNFALVNHHQIERVQGIGNTDTLTPAPSSKFILTTEIISSLDIDLVDCVLNLCYPGQRYSWEFVEEILQKCTIEEFLGFETVLLLSKNAHQYIPQEIQKDLQAHKVPQQLKGNFIDFDPITGYISYIPLNRINLFPKDVSKKNEFFKGELRDKYQVSQKPGRFFHKLYPDFSPTDIQALVGLLKDNLPKPDTIEVLSGEAILDIFNPYKLIPKTDVGNLYSCMVNKYSDRGDRFQIYVDNCKAIVIRSGAGIRARAVVWPDVNFFVGGCWHTYTFVDRIYTSATKESPDNPDYEKIINYARTNGWAYKRSHGPSEDTVITPQGATNIYYSKLSKYAAEYTLVAWLDTMNYNYNGDRYVGSLWGIDKIGLRGQNYNIRSQGGAVFGSNRHELLRKLRYADAPCACGNNCSTSLSVDVGGKKYSRECPCITIYKGSYVLIDDIVTIKNKQYLKTDQDVVLYGKTWKLRKDCVLIRDGSSMRFFPIKSPKIQWDMNSCCYVLKPKKKK